MFTGYVRLIRWSEVLHSASYTWGDPRARWVLHAGLHAHEPTALDNARLKYVRDGPFVLPWRGREKRS